MVKITAILFCIILISGCGILPLWLSITHTVGDIILYDKTGKTSSEHVLDAATGKNCKFVRVLQNKEVCLTEKEYEQWLYDMNCHTYTWDIIGRVYCSKGLDN
jgi:hypothetical protein